MAIVARNKADLEATARELAAETNRRILPLAADVTSTEQVDRMVARANFRAFHVVEVLDHLVLNRGKPKAIGIDNGPECAGRLLDQVGLSERCRA